MSEPSKFAVEAAAKLALDSSCGSLIYDQLEKESQQIIQLAIDQACATKDASIEAFDTRNEQLVEEIAALKAEISNEKFFHQSFDNICASMSKRHEQQQERIAALEADMLEAVKQIARHEDQESDAGIYFARCQQHAERIAALEALLNGLHHNTIPGLGSSGCESDCPACAWAAMKEAR